MLIIPAIDLKGNKVVRLYKGDFKKISHYNIRPDEIVRRFLTAGVKRLHIVFLWGAHTGHFSEEMDVLAKIIKVRDIYDSSCKIQVGGGIRRYEQVRIFIEQGVDYVIMGTALLIPIALEKGFFKNDIKHFYQQAGKKFDEEKEIPEIELIDRLENRTKEKIIVSIDYQKDETALSGWEVTLPLTPYYMIRELLRKGFKRFIITDVSRDGTLRGVDIVAIENILQKICNYSENIEEVIVSGGITTEADIERLIELKYKINGVIIGKALYQDRLDIHMLIKKFQEGR